MWRENSDIRCTVCLSELVPQNKILAIQTLGAEVDIAGAQPGYYARSRCGPRRSRRARDGKSFRRSCNHCRPGHDCPGAPERDSRCGNYPGAVERGRIGCRHRGRGKGHAPQCPSGGDRQRSLSGNAAQPAGRCTDRGTGTFRVSRMRWEAESVWKIASRSRWCGISSTRFNSSPTPKSRRRCVLRSTMRAWYWRVRRRCRSPHCFEPREVNSPAPIVAVVTGDNIDPHCC